MSIRNRIVAVLATASISAMTLFGFTTSALAATATVDAANGNLQFNNTVKIGQNALVGFSTRYTTVFTGVDALVTVTAVSNSTLQNIDRVSTVNNWQLWTNEQVGAGGGFTTYRVEFVAAGTRTPVIMKNFNVNVGDIDARQFVEFTGPTSYTLSNDSQLAIQQNPTNGIPVGAYRFAELNGTGSTDDDTRFWAQVQYSEVSAIDVKLGAGVGGSALFQVSFGAASWGGTAATPVAPPIPPSYTVSYELNQGGASGASGAPASTSAVGGTAQTIQPGTGMTPPTGGYAFVSWNTQADGSGVSYAAADTILPTTDVTLFAIWKSTNTTVTYFGNGSTGGQAPAAATVAAGAQYVIAGNTGALVADGYQFIGWNTDASGTGVFFDPGTLTSIVANTNLYAIWQALPVVPPDTPINIDVQPGEPIGGAEVDYVIPDQPYVPNCDPTANPESAWTIMVTPLDPAGPAYQIDAGCAPADGDIYGTAVLPQDVPAGVYEVVYESTSGEKIIRYFEVGPGGTFIGQTNTDPRLANTGSEQSTLFGAASAAGALLLLGVLMMITIRRKRNED